MTQIRVYRDDDALYKESDYVALVDNKYLYLATLIHAQIPDWNQSIIELLMPIFCPEPGLFSGTVGTLGGWHYLLDTENIQEVRNQPILEHRFPGDHAFVVEEKSENLLQELDMYHPEYHVYRNKKKERFHHADGILTTLQEHGVLLPIEYGFLTNTLATRFSVEQFQKALPHAQAGEEVFFRFHEWGQEKN